MGNRIGAPTSIKKKWLPVINALVVIVLIVIGLNFEVQITKNVEVDERFRDYFESDQEFDVLFFGSSHMVHSVDTMQLWKDYGITSYNFGGYATWIPSSYWVFRNAIEVHKPKVAVMEVFGAWNNKSEQDYSMLHYTFDAFPFSLIKNDAVRDLTEDENAIEELLFPFSIYHNTWDILDFSKIERAIHLKPNKTNKGTVFLYDVYNESTRLAIHYTYPEKEWLTHSQLYLIRFVDDCKKRGIQPVFLYVPFDVEANDNYFSKIANEKVVPLIDLYAESNDYINYMTDFADRAHLNYSGATKVTEAVGKTLCGIGITFDHSISQQERWNSEYDDYERDLRKRLEETELIYEALLLLTKTNEEVELVLDDNIKSEMLKQTNNLFKFEFSAIDQTAMYRNTMQRLRIEAQEELDSIRCNYSNTNWSFGYIEICGKDGTKNYDIVYDITEKNNGFVPRIYKDEELSDPTKLVLAIDGGNRESFASDNDYFVLSNISITESMEDSFVACVVEASKNERIIISDRICDEGKISLQFRDVNGTVKVKDLFYK